jgi:dienelactone hydrolase
MPGRILALLTSLVACACAAPQLPFPDEPAFRSLFYGFGRPARGEGPHPAVVLLHTCGGIAKHLYDWSGFLNSHGYATVIVDSFGPRGASRCTIPTYFPATVNEVMSDASAAISHLRRRPGIDPARIAVIGFSWGGNAALRMSSRGARGDRAAPAAIAAFYPICTPWAGAVAGDVGDNLRTDADVPTVVIIGADDHDTPSVVANCASRVEQLRRQGRAVGLEVIPDAGHNFDAYGGEATRDAEGRLLRFLGQHVPVRAARAP